jgi:hypothetical protein
VFHYYRYFAAGELLAPVAILALLRMLDARRLPHAWLAVAVVVLATATTGSWGRSDWTDGPLCVRVPPVPAKTPAVVLVDGSGISFALPFFPPGTRFFDARAGGPFGRLVARELERHQGPVLRLRPYHAAPTPLERFGLVDDGRCEAFRTDGRGRLALCPLSRLSPGS